jgi:hypothetical protein
MSGLWWKVHDFILETNSHRSILSSQRHITTPTFGFSNFHTHLLLQELSFLCEKERIKVITSEREDILPWRSKYIVWLRSSRNKIRALRTYESWVNRADTIWKNRKNTWLTPLQRKVILAGRSTGLKSPRGRGVSSVCVGNEKGFVLKVELMYLCQKNIADVQDEIVGDCYEKCFVEKLLANLLLNM